MALETIFSHAAEHLCSSIVAQVPHLLTSFGSQYASFPGLLGGKEKAGQAWLATQGGPCSADHSYVSPVGGAHLLHP